MSHKDSFFFVFPEEENLGIWLIYGITFPTLLSKAKSINSFNLEVQNIQFLKCQILMILIFPTFLKEENLGI